MIIVIIIYDSYNDHHNQEEVRGRFSQEVTVVIPQGMGVAVLKVQSASLSSPSPYCQHHHQHHSHYCIVTGCSPVWSRPLHCPCETRQVHLWYWSHKTLCSGDIVIIIGIDVDIAIRRNKLTSVISREFTQLRSWLFEVDAPGVWICLMYLFGRDSRSQGHHHHHYHCHHPALQR